MTPIVGETYMDYETGLVIVIRHIENIWIRAEAINESPIVEYKGMYRGIADNGKPKLYRRYMKTVSLFKKDFVLYHKNFNPYFIYFGVLLNNVWRTYV
jgi:hypothetical protein